MRPIPALLLGALVFSLSSAAGCAGQDPPCTDGLCVPVCGVPTGPVRKDVIARFLMPTAAAPCSIDIDGDGKLDNALALVVSALKGTFDLQANVDALVQSGGLLQLLSLQTTSIVSDDCGSLTLARAAAPPTPPAFDGSDALLVSAGFPALRLPATLREEALQTPLPAVQTAATLERISLTLSAGFGVALPLPLYGVHVAARAGNLGISSGEVHGVVRSDDIQGVIIPAIAQTMTAFIHANPGSGDAQALFRTFESSAKCQATPDLCCARAPMTCQITADELRHNGLVTTFLKPDVQMFSGDTWMPTAAGDQPDGLSVGLCFTALGASF